MAKRVVVVGGGVAGLATALALRDAAAAAGRPLEVSLVEAAPRLGGNLRSERADGFVVEWGPNGFLDNAPATLDLVERIGLGGELQPADPRAARRFLFRRGRLHELPGGPLSFLFNPVLSLPGRLRVLGEPFAAARPAGVDESVHAFAARRIGEEAAAVLVDAMVSGVFAGDARALSLASAFPRMAAMEAEHGGLVRAMLARGRQRRAAQRDAEARRARGEDVRKLTRAGGPAGPGGTLTSFRGGIETLIEGLARALGPGLETGRALRALVPGADGPGWRLELDGGERRAADAVVLAAPATRARPLLAPLDPRLDAVLGEMPAAGLAVVALAFRAAAIGGAPNGFGFLAPRGEGLRLLGCLWDSSIFPGRAPAGHVLVRAMIGGAHDPAAVALSDDELVAEARADLARAMQLTAPPERTWVFRHPLGIGQYTLGHGARLERLAAALADHPGLHVAGQSYFGIAMNAAIEQAPRTAAAVLAGLD